MHSPDSAPIRLDGQSLTLDKTLNIALGAPIKLDLNTAARRRLDQSAELIQRRAAGQTPIYGVNTSFGALANQLIRPDKISVLQENLLFAHKAGSGGWVDRSLVRAMIAARINALLRGVSGIRYPIIERLALLLEADLIPQIHENGSIGASGDLVPLAYIAGAAMGIDNRYRVDFQGQEMGAVDALKKLGLKPLTLSYKEGLALINGTSAMAAIAAVNLAELRTLMTINLAIHAMIAEALLANTQSFAPFTHRHKPHPGQIWVAEKLRSLLKHSQLATDQKLEDRGDGHPFQDRYGLRCAPQFMGPALDGLKTAQNQIEIELNSATDNPLIDISDGQIYHGGNFLGQYVATAMDQTRYHLSLLAKHLDVQVAHLVAPEFNGGLPPSLIGNTQNAINVGLKALQISLNSIVPMIAYHGQSLADRFPTYAEQFNQNINSQGYGSALLTQKSVRLFRLALAKAMIFAVQGLQLRAKSQFGHYDPRGHMGEGTRTIFELACAALEHPKPEDGPLVGDDRSAPLDEKVTRLHDALTPGRAIFRHLQGKFDLP